MAGPNPFFCVDYAVPVSGLAPFKPEPHLVEKTRMLFQGDLVRPLDMVDLMFHAAAPLLLMVKIIRLYVKQ
ncbi:MAG: hypothetical protein R2874_15065 [Desulfobacterales bacterium]